MSKRADAGTIPASVRIVPVYVALFFTIGVALPYWPAWLESRGLSAELIGVLLGIGPWVRFAINPSVGRFADRRGIAHRLVVLGALILVLSYVGLWYLGTSVLAIAALVFVGAVGFGPLVPLADSVVIRAAGVDYGRLRAWGSGAFIAASFVGGVVLDGRGADAILLALLACAVTMALTGLALPAPAPRALGGRDEVARRSAWETPGFASFLATVALLNGSHAALYGFGTLHWRATGIDEIDIGVLWAVAVVAEILFFMAGGRLSARLGPRWLLGLSACGGVLRWLLLATDPSFAVLLGAQLLHALTFAAMHMAVMDFVQTRVDPRATAHATSLYSALATGVALGVLMPLTGLLYAQLGGRVFAVMAGLSGLALIVTLVQALRRPR